MLEKRTSIGNVYCTPTTNNKKWLFCSKSDDHDDLRLYFFGRRYTFCSSAGWTLSMASPSRWERNQVIFSNPTRFLEEHHELIIGSWWVHDLILLANIWRDIFRLILHIISCVHLKHPFLGRLNYYLRALHKLYKWVHA